MDLLWVHFGLPFTNRSVITWLPPSATLIWVRYFSDATFSSIAANYDEKLLPFKKHYDEKMEQVSAMKPGKRREEIEQAAKAAPAVSTKPSWDAFTFIAGTSAPSMLIELHEAEPQAMNFESAGKSGTEIYTSVPPFVVLYRA